MTSALSALFPEADYRHTMRFQRGDPADFFRPTGGAAHTPHPASGHPLPSSDEGRGQGEGCASTGTNSILAERAHWLTENPTRYTSLLPEGESLLRETLSLASDWKSIPATHKDGFDSPDAPTLSLALGRAWEPDWLLLKPDAQGAMRLWAGCVCFPSSWALEEKMGKPIDFIHAPVPGLNETLGTQIDGFLRRMKPGISWLRENWGLSRWPDLNQHPARGLRRLDGGVSLAEVWLRVEYQALVALPESQGVLFGIRVAAHPLAAVKADATAAAGLARALRTMPDAMAAYKGLASSRERIVQLLEE